MKKLATFKFGDKIQHPELGLCVVTGFMRCNGYFMTVQNKKFQTDMISSVTHPELFDPSVLIIEPDTVRLNWLEAQAESNNHVSFEYDGTFFTMNHSGNELYGNPDIRYAIDLANESFPAEKKKL